jgi:hypothetical protein
MHMLDQKIRDRSPSRPPAVVALAFLLAVAGAPAAGDPAVAPSQEGIEPLGPGVLETDADEYGPTLSADDNEIFFVRRQSRRGAETIMHSTRTADGWSEPQVAPFSGEYHDKEPYLSPDGRRLFFASTRPAAPGGDDSAFDIWTTTRSADGWSDPVRLPDAVNSDAYDNYPAVAANGNLYFGSRRGGGQSDQLDLYVSRWVDGAYQPAENLGAPINTAATEADPYIAPDESFLVFISTKPGGAGSGDLYISRRDDGGWNEPENMGPTVNGDDFDYTPFVSADGETLYFSRGWGAMWKTSFAPWRR